MRHLTELFPLPQYHTAAELNVALPYTLAKGHTVLVGQPFVPLCNAQALTLWGVFYVATGGLDTATLSVTADTVDAEGADNVINFSLVPALDFQGAVTVGFQVTVTALNGGYYVFRNQAGMLLSEATFYYSFAAMQGIGFTLFNSFDATAAAVFTNLGLTLR